MNPSVRRKLLAGLELAVRRVREVHECHDLFSRLGSDGAEKLFKALYFPANTYGELHVCRRSVAFVKMSGSQTWLCRGFAKLSAGGDHADPRGAAPRRTRGGLEGANARRNRLDGDASVSTASFARSG
jgi:hypothetical protein